MLLEVAALKIPIISSNIEENRAVFNDDEVLYFQSGNVMDLAEKIRYALFNRHEMDKRAALAFKKVQEYYQWSEIAKQYASIFAKLHDLKESYRRFIDS